MSTHRDAWLETAGRDLPLDAAALFPEGDGFWERRRAATRAKRIAKLRPVLQKLEPGERVRHVALGVRYAFAEFYFSGYFVAHQTNLTALVLTDRRLLLVHCRSNGAPRDVKNQLRLEQVREVKPRSLLAGAWILTADGKKLYYQGLPKADALRLRDLVAEARGGDVPAEPPPAASGAASVEALCPACLAPVPGAPATAQACSRPECRIPFRSARRAARLSALVPGVGDVYLRHHLFGAWEFVVSIALLCVAIWLLAEAATGDAAVVAAIVLALFVGLPRVIDYFLTLHMGRKGYVPLADRPAPGADPRNLPAFPGWAVALFAAGALAVGGTALGSVWRAGERKVVREAIAAAGEGRFDAALAGLREGEAKGVVTGKDQADLALALLAQGDVSDAEALVAAIDPAALTDAKRSEVDARYGHYLAAFEAYQRGVQALADGDEQGAWKELDPALVVLATVKRPPMPATRAEVALELAGGVLAGPAAPGWEQVAAVTRLVELGEGGGARLAVVTAAVAAASGEAEAARAKLAARGEKLAGPHWQLLELETRLAIARDAAEAAAVGAEAKALVGLDEAATLRRDALVGAAAAPR